MTSSAEPYGEVVERDLRGIGRTVVHEDELIRHPPYTRVVHWTVAIFFFGALLSGMAVYSVWLFSWITPLVGVGPMTRCSSSVVWSRFCHRVVFSVPQLATGDDLD